MASIVRVALADFFVSAVLVAVTLTWASVGTALGAVYTPVELIFPTVALPPAMPFTAQVTVVTEAFLTVALNFSQRPVLIAAEAGVMLTITAGGGGGGLVMVTVALPTADATALL